MRCLLTCLVLLPLASSGQNTPEPDSKNIIYATVAAQDYNCYPANIMVGLGYELDVRNNFKLNYRLDAGNNYFHMPLGLPIGVIVYLAMAASGNKEFSDVMLFAAMIPEGFGYEIKVGRNTVIKPYLNLLGFDYIKPTQCLVDNDEEQEPEFHAMLGLGGNISFDMGANFRLSGFSEYRSSWGGLRKGWQSGIKLGYKVDF